MTKLFFPIVDAGYQPNAKRGIGCTTCNPGFPGTGEMLRNLNVSWVYQWWPHVPSWTQDQGISTVGMATTMRPNLTSNGSDQMMLGFNEPDVGSTPLSPVYAADLWRVVELANPNRNLVSPAVVRDLNWLRQMRDAYQTRYRSYPRFHHLGLHCYPLDGKNVIDYCRPRIDKMSKWLQEWNIPGGIVLNEWSSDKTSDDQLREVEFMVRWLESNPNIHRHAMWTLAYRGDEWFAPGFMTRCYDCNGVMTPLGQTYAEA